MASRKRHLGLGSAPGIDPRIPVSTNCSSAEGKRDGWLQRLNTLSPSPPKKRGSPWGKREACRQGTEHVHGMAQREKLILQLPRQYL